MKVPYEIPDLGISFSRFAARDFELHCATWRDGCNSHVYYVRVMRSVVLWTATLENDGREVGRVMADTKAACAELALGAMRAYIIRGHRKTLRTMAKDAKEAYAQCHPYEMALLAACDSDLNLAHAVEAVALKRGFTADSLRGANFAKILEMTVVSVAMSNTPDASNAPATEGGAE